MRALSRLGARFSANASSRSTASTGPRRPTPIRSSSRGATPTAEDREVAGWIASAFAYGQVRDDPAERRAAFSRRSGRGRRGARSHRATFARFAREELSRLPPPLPRRRRRGRAALRDRPRARRRPGPCAPSSSASSAPRRTGRRGPRSRAPSRASRPSTTGPSRPRRLPERSPVRFFFPDPAAGSACKRWNLYLRWMVRRTRSTSASGRASRPTASSSRPTRTSTASRGASG